MLTPARFSIQETHRPPLRIKITISLPGKTRICHPRHFKVNVPPERNDDRSIDNGFALQFCLGISRVQEHKTAANRKSIRSVYSSVELVHTTDHGTKQENLQMRRLSPQRLFVSVLSFDIVDRCDVFENGIDKQENRDERSANLQSRKPHSKHWGRIAADNRQQKRNGNVRE